MDSNHFFISFRFWRRRWFYPLISAAVALCLCLSTLVPARAIDLLPLILRGVQVIQLSNVSERQEYDIGKQINQELVNTDVRLYRNADITDYVEQIGRRLVRSSDRPNLPYTFQVVEDNSINAFATLGGFVYINTGLIKTADNEAELASVIAHEIGHIGGKHVIKEMRQRAIESGLLSAAGLDRSTAVQLGVQIARNLPRSRQNEFDADKRGLRTLSNSGYAQSAMVSFMQKLQKKGSSAPSFLSTHPATGDRVTSLRRSIASQPSKGGEGLDSNSYKIRIRGLARS